MGNKTLSIAVVVIVVVSLAAALGAFIEFINGTFVRDIAETQKETVALRAELMALQARLEQFQDVRRGPTGKQGLKGDTGPAGPPGPAGLNAQFPAGAVVAFDRSCPEGWRFFESGSGRFILGAGKGRGLSEREIGDKAGEEEVTLTEAQMPRHAHRPPLNKETFNTEIPGIGHRFNDNAQNQGNHKFTGSGETGFAGGGRPHNNMPPYIALYFCKKD